jgi:hypothetical protein
MAHQPQPPHSRPLHDKAARDARNKAQTAAAIAKAKEDLLNWDNMTAQQQEAALMGPQVVLFNTLRFADGDRQGGVRDWDQAYDGNTDPQPPDVVSPSGGGPSFGHDAQGIQLKCAIPDDVKKRALADLDQQAVDLASRK